MRIFTARVALLVVTMLVDSGASKFDLCPFRCPYIVGCNVNGHCKFGREFDYCDCCNRCLKGVGMSCGGPHGVFGKCTEGFFCDKSRGKKGLLVPNPIGVCRSLTDDMICPADTCIPETCPRVSCRYGTGKPVCGCCPICLRGLGERCDPYRRCSKGLYCDESFVNPLGEAEGVCKIWSTFPVFRGPRTRA